MWLRLSDTLMSERSQTQRCTLFDFIPMKFENIHNSSMMIEIRITVMGGALPGRGPEGAIWGTRMFCSLTWVVNARVCTPNVKFIAPHI